MEIKDRIIEMKRMTANEIRKNLRNWRTHPEDQRDVMSGVLRSIGIADALIAYYSERDSGALTLINGHLRQDIAGDTIWPILITDLNDDEADLLLAIFDPITAMAGIDADKAVQLANEVITGEWAVRDLVHRLEIEAGRAERETLKDEQKQQEAGDGPDAMELLPFEHYDYILVMFKNEMDWQSATELLGLKKLSDPRKTKRVGMARVIDGAKLVDLLKKSQHTLVDLGELAQ